MRVNMVIVSADQSHGGRRALARQSQRGGGGTKVERKRD